MRRSSLSSLSPCASSLLKMRAVSTSHALETSSAARFVPDTCAAMAQGGLALGSVLTHYDGTRCHNVCGAFLAVVRRILHSSCRSRNGHPHHQAAATRSRRRGMPAASVSVFEPRHPVRTRTKVARVFLDPGPSELEQKTLQPRDNSSATRSSAQISGSGRDPCLRAGPRWSG